MESIRVLIVDDHPVYRDGLRTLLDSIPDAEVAGEAVSGEEAVAMAASLEPDVILMDLKMPGINGIEATRRILHTTPHIAVLVVTMFEDDDSVFAAMRAGARGYLLKGADQTEIVRAIRSVANGEAIFGPAIAQRLISFFASPSPPVPPKSFPELTEREREILTVIAQGHSNTEIADRLGLSQKTVRNHVSNIFNKLQVADRAQAIVRAREAGLGKADANPGSSKSI
jgi:DNA-binding NarL/FixJ family response regulator